MRNVQEKRDFACARNCNNAFTNITRDAFCLVTLNDLRTTDNVTRLNCPLLPYWERVQKTKCKRTKTSRRGQERTKCHSLMTRKSNAKMRLVLDAQVKTLNVWRCCVKTGGESGSSTGKQKLPGKFVQEEHGKSVKARSPHLTLI